MEIPYLKPAGGAGFTDRFVRKAHEIIKPWDGGEVKGFSLLGIPLSKSSISPSGASLAPGVIRGLFSSFTTYAVEEDTDLKGIEITDLGDVEMHATDIVLSHRRIEEAVHALVSKNPAMIPIFLGGDHSISAGTIQGFAGVKGKIGVIQFDAHHDLRNVEDGGPTNGTPFRRLLEGGVIEGGNLIQIGIRNFVNSRPYREYAESMGVSFYTMKEVRTRPTEEILDEALAKLRGKVDAVYLSIDMDVLDQAYAPGCPAAGPGGMDIHTLISAISYLSRREEVKAVDIVEVDPRKDIREMTSRAAAYLILTFLAGKLNPT